MSTHQVDQIVSRDGNGPVSTTFGIVNPKAPALLAKVASFSVGASFADVGFTTTLTDTNSAFSGSTTFTVPAGCGGLYNISANFTISPSATTGGTFNCKILVNGVQIVFTMSMGLANAGQNYNTQVFAFGYALSAGDTVRIQAQQNTGSPVSASGVFNVNRTLGSS